MTLPEYLNKINEVNAACYSTIENMDDYEEIVVSLDRYATVIKNEYKKNMTEDNLELCAATYWRIFNFHKALGLNGRKLFDKSISELITDMSANA